MIIEETFYAIKCDCCGKIISDCGDFEFWSDKSTAIDYACENGAYLTEDDENIYCPDCYEFDDNDNLVIYKEKNTQKE